MTLDCQALVLFGVQGSGFRFSGNGVGAVQGVVRQLDLGDIKESVGSCLTATLKYLSDTLLIFRCYF